MHESETNTHAIRLIFVREDLPLLIVNFPGQPGVRFPLYRQNGARIRRLYRLCVGWCLEGP